MIPELIDLQSASATQLTSNGVKGEWKINRNVTNDLLQILPSTISDELMFTILDFARKYELIAFNAGIMFQKGKENEVLLATIKELKINNASWMEENERLASALDTQ